MEDDDLDWGELDLEPIKIENLPLPSKLLTNLKGSNENGKGPKLITLESMKELNLPSSKSGETLSIKFKGLGKQEGSEIIIEDDDEIEKKKYGKLGSSLSPVNKRNGNSPNENSNNITSKLQKRLKAVKQFKDPELRALASRALTDEADAENSDNSDEGKEDKEKIDDFKTGKSPSAKKEIDLPVKNEVLKSSNDDDWGTDFHLTMTSGLNANTDTLTISDDDDYIFDDTKELKPQFMSNGKPVLIKPNTASGDAKVGKIRFDQSTLTWVGNEDDPDFQDVDWGDIDIPDHTIGGGNKKLKKKKDSSNMTSLNAFKLTTWQKQQFSRCERMHKRFMRVQLQSFATRNKKKLRGTSSQTLTLKDSLFDIHSLAPEYLKLLNERISLASTLKEVSTPLIEQIL